jgi:hypothetical protein
MTGISAPSTNDPTPDAKTHETFEDFITSGKEDFALHAVNHSSFDIGKPVIVKEERRGIFSMQRRDDTIWGISNNGIGQDKGANDLSSAHRSTGLILLAFDTLDRLGMEDQIHIP